MATFYLCRLKRFNFMGGCAPHLPPHGGRHKNRNGKYKMENTKWKIQNGKELRNKNR
jgi:hypothetical protein